jgi:hypothetical protein
LRTPDFYRSGQVDPAASAAGRYCKSQLMACADNDSVALDDSLRRRPMMGRRKEDEGQIFANRSPRQGHAAPLRCETQTVVRTYNADDSQPTSG